MEQPTQAPTQTPPPFQAPQTLPPMPPAGQAPAQTPPTAAPAKKSHAWAWILGSCLTIVILVVVALGALAWWGAQKVKNEINKYQPGMDSVKENIDKMKQDSTDWEQKAKELQEKMPSPDNFPVGNQNVK